MKKNKILWSFLMTMLLLVAIPIVSKAATGDTVSFDVTVEENYKYAFEVLNIVNKERKAQGLVELKMDKDLLDAAMIRANELVLDYGCDNQGRNHERPDGRRCFTVIEKPVGGAGENIAAGHYSPENVMNAWMNSPGHKANILTASYRTIGIGVAKYGNTYHWVQIFGTTNLAEITKIPANRNITRSIPMLVKNIKISYNSTSSIYKETLKNGKFEPEIVVINPGWTIRCTEIPLNKFIYESSDTSVLKIDQNGIMTCVRPGKVTLTIRHKENKALFVTEEITVFGNIAKIDISKINDQEYTGSEIKPNVTIKDNDYKLVKDTDYTLSYSYNIEYGKATATIVGKGYYTGVIEKTFNIVPKKVTKLKAKSNSDSKIKISWKKISGVTGYKVYVYNNSKKKYEYYKSTSSNTMTIKKLKPGTKYKIRVRAYKNRYGTKYHGKYSSTLSTITVPKKVTKLKAKSVKKNSIKISWKKISGVTGYKVYVYNSSKKKYEYYGKTKSTSMTIKKLKAGKKYKIKVRAYKSFSGKQYLGSYSSVLSKSTKR